MLSVISSNPPRDGRTWDCQCARCGSTVDYVRCDQCEDGYDGHDCGDDCCCCADPEDNVVCQICRGHGGWYRCMSSMAWCEANPLPGREAHLRGSIEWFLDDSLGDQS